MDLLISIVIFQFDLHPAIVGLMFLIPPVVVVILAPIVGWVTDKFKVSRLLFCIISKL